jgi:Zn-dependent protease with chaperone function
MSRTMLTVTVAFAAFAITNATVSLAAAAWWRLVMARSLPAPATRRARWLLWLRSLPVVVSAAVTLTIVVPSFVIFEPNRGAEMTGPYLVSLAAMTVLLFAASSWIGLHAALNTYLTARQWLRSSSPLAVDPPAGVPAFAIHTAAPIVALVGVFRPKLVAAQSVIDACTGAELNAIVSHERGHLRSRDNLKRWLMACAPDVLRWTPVHGQIVSAWHDAAEDAADDVATDGSDAARADLAALLVKIARLTPAPAWPAAAVSPFAEIDGLSRRVTRLLAAPANENRRPNLAPIVAALGTAAMLAVISSPRLMEDVFDIVETLVALGR